MLLVESFKNNLKFWNNRFSIKLGKYSEEMRLLEVFLFFQNNYLIYFWRNPIEMTTQW